MVEEIVEKKIFSVKNYCENRIKPQIIRDVKTEAILVFARTALERYFDRFEKENNKLILNSVEDTNYVNDSLRELLNDLQKYVVNVEYLMTLIQNAKQNPQNLEFKKLAKYEEPLITYYDSMAKRISYQFPSKTAAIPELIVINMLSIWFQEEEKSSILYPFINKYDSLKLIGKYEKYSQGLDEDNKKVISLMQKVSIDVVEVLKNVKYKFNTDRKSKVRKNRSKNK